VVATEQEVENTYESNHMPSFIAVPHLAEISAPFAAIMSSSNDRRFIERSLNWLLFYPSCIRQYSRSLSLSSVSRLRVRSQKISLNDATGEANDTKMTIANASHSLA
jgi:hypothetical protein